jgi:hypothetical protein
MQSFGYEEDPQSGQLRPSKPPASRRPLPHGPGPMQYAIHQEWNPKGRAASAYGRDRTVRTDFVKESGRAYTPGPGTYRPDALEAQEVLDAGPGGVVFGRGIRGDRRSAAFRSRVERGAALRLRGSEGVPGPGAHYNARTMSAIRKHPRPPPEYQSFGSTAQRSNLEGGGGTPGPIYDLPGAIRSRGAAARTDGVVPPRALARSISPSKLPRGDVVTERVGFAVSQVRFWDLSDKDRKHFPPVGQYEAPTSFRRPTVPLGAKVVHSMGTAGRSELGVSQETGEVGPGAYTPGGFASIHTDLARGRPSVSFKSSLGRQDPATGRLSRVVESPEAHPAPVEQYRLNVGPGSYDVGAGVASPVTFSTAAQGGKGLVASGPPRFGKGGAMDGAMGSVPPDVGPGSYDLAGKVPSPPRAQPTLSQAPRFRGKRVVSEVPGPGQYSTRPSWSTRTYNVTVAQSELSRVSRFE